MPGLKESTYPQGPILADGYYPATLKEVTEYTKTYDGKESPRLAWIFDVEADEEAIDDAVEIEDEEYTFDGTFEIAAHTGINKSKAANSNWHKLSMSTIVPDDCKNTDDVIGAKCIVNVSSYVGEDNMHKNTIEKIRPPKACKAGKEGGRRKRSRSTNPTSRISPSSAQALHTGHPAALRVAGGFVPSVTSVIRFLENKEWMNSYIARNGRRELDTIRDSAAVLGTKIHALAQEIAWNRATFCEPGMEPFGDAIREFYDAHVRTVVYTELPLVSERERVGGTLDAYVQLQDGSMAVVDMKCKRSTGITDVNRVQTAGYALLLREHGYEVNKRVVLRSPHAPG